MRHVLDSSRVRYLVTTEAKEKRDQNGQQKIDRKTGELLFQFQVMALDETGGEMLTVTVAGILPKVTVGQYVHLVELEALPWATTGMVLAEAVQAHELTCDHPMWPHIDGWAAELGLSGPDAAVRVSDPPQP